MNRGYEKRYAYRPGPSEAWADVIGQREPVPGDPCITGDGCLVHPPHVIDPLTRTRIRRSSLRASTARIPRNGFVDVLGPVATVDVTEKEEDGEVIAYFTPNPLGSHTFYQIRFCYPGTSPLQCVEGWTERYNLVPGAVPGKHTPAEETSFWEDVGDFITDPDTWTIIGTIATLGSYGWVAGILGSAQSVALQEAMKALPGMAVNIAACIARDCQGMPLEQCLQGGRLPPDVAARVKECTIGERSPNFANAWKSQVALRMKIAATSYASAGLASLATSVPPQILTAVRSIAEATGYGNELRALEARLIANQATEETLRRDLLADAKGRFVNDPDPMKRRDDVLAMGINYHLRRQLFNVTHWDPMTGRQGRRLIQKDPNRRPPPTRRNYSVEELESLWRRAVEHQAPQVVVDALKARYDRALRYRANFGVLRTQPSEQIELVRTSSGQVGDIGTPGTPGAPGTGPEFVSGARGLLGHLMVLSLLTAPAWVPMALLPALRRRGIL